MSIDYHFLSLPITTYSHFYRTDIESIKETFGFNEWLNQPQIQDIILNKPIIKRELESEFNSLFQNPSRLTLSKFDLFAYEIHEKNLNLIRHWKDNIFLTGPFINGLLEARDYIKLFCYLKNNGYTNKLPIKINNVNISLGDIESGFVMLSETMTMHNFKKEFEELFNSPNKDISDIKSSFEEFNKIICTSKSKKHDLFIYLP